MLRHMFAYMIERRGHMITDRTGGNIHFLGDLVVGQVLLSVQAVDPLLLCEQGTDRIFNEFKVIPKYRLIFGMGGSCCILSQTFSASAFSRAAFFKKSGVLLVVTR